MSTEFAAILFPPIIAAIGAIIAAWISNRGKRGKRQRRLRRFRDRWQQRRLAIIRLRSNEAADRLFLDHRLVRFASISVGLRRIVDGMRAAKMTIENLRAMGTRQRQTYKKKLQAELAEMQARREEIKAGLKSIREAEEMPGHVTINEFLSERFVELTTVQKSQLGERLQKGANRGDWDQGQKTVATNTKARCARVPTYAPSVIKGILKALKNS